MATFTWIASIGASLTVKPNVRKVYLTKLLANEAVKSYIQRHEPEILEQFELVVNTVSMEEAVQQQSETTPADAGEASES